MAGKGLSDADRFLMEAVDSVPDSRDRRVNLTTLATEDGFEHAEASAEAWQTAGYGVCEQPRSGTDAFCLVFAFSVKGYALAKQEADRLHAVGAASSRRRWRLDINPTSAWVAGAVFVIALLYNLVMYAK